MFANKNSDFDEFQHFAQELLAHMYNKIVLYNINTKNVIIDTIGKPNSCVEQRIVSDSVCLCGLLSSDMRPHKQLELIQLAVPYTSVDLLLSFIAYKWSQLLIKINMYTPFQHCLFLILVCVCFTYIFIYMFYFCKYLFMSPQNAIYGGLCHIHFDCDMGAVLFPTELYHILQLPNE